MPRIRSQAASLPIDADVRDGAIQATHIRNGMMRKLLCLVCVGLGALAVMQCTVAFAQSVQNLAAPSGPVSPPKTTNEQSSADMKHVCEQEWRANRDSRMGGL